MTNILYLDSDNAQNVDYYKKQLKDILSMLGRVDTINLSTDPIQCCGISHKIKNYDGVVIIWNNLKPLSLWAIDLCRRFDKKYTVVERGVVPTQLDNNYAFYSGGIGFECTNIDPKYFDPNTYASNLLTISSHYTNNNLAKTETKNKIVFVGQLLFDSTMTHFFNIESYPDLIEKYLSQSNIDHKDTEIVFCPHPRDDKNQYQNFKYRLSDKKTITECLDAKLVVAVSSTIIYELYGLDIKTDIIGFGYKRFPTQRNWKHKFHCLSTALDFHFDTTTAKDVLETKLNRSVSINKVL